MHNLGNITRDLRLKCKICGRGWPDTTPMEAVKLHLQVEHDTDKIEMDLVPICTCGKFMAATGKSSYKDYFVCECGNTGFARRKPDAAS